ncbi:MAG TPA: hypothetical protein VGF45_09360, partial [Polyangia bacterium]
MACAGPQRERRALPPLAPDSERGWQALVEGDLAKAKAAFAGDDSARVFGRITLASANGDDRSALVDSLDLLERQLSRPDDARAALLAEATAARLMSLVDGVVDPRSLEDRLLGLRVEGLPWRARLAVENAVDAIARRRGDSAILEARPAHAGCLTEVREVARVGRLARLDLGRALESGQMHPGKGTDVRRSGCRLWLPPGPGWPGVRVLRAHLPPARVPRTLVFDHEGPALVNVSPALAEGVPAKAETAQIKPLSFTHESAEFYGPRARAVTLPPSMFGVTVEVRLGDFGGATELRLFAFPAVAEGEVEADNAGVGDGALMDLARLLSAEATGETEVALARAARLVGRRRFAPGLIAAARVSAADPSRPAALTRAEADGLLRRALAAAPGQPRAA